MLISSTNSALLVIDIQEKLLPALNNADQLMTNSQWLIEIAEKISIPTLVTEQYPKGLGHTSSVLIPFLTSARILEKEHFSAAEEDHILQAVSQLEKEQLILIGAESHVCLLQSAIGFCEQGYDVYVVTDAVASRKASDYETALRRMQQNGIQLVTKEMVAFEWLHKSNTALFREISQGYLR
ncbi:hydrolase [Oceanospirillum maris]|jgi:nicotinamidase-related amidase|uniref:hydrolase n=1 Tax=Oceanospirillum maris TaxID=64977 RepID=UPI00040B101B|nr:hydrolase [Oceanospirillum maris]